MIGSCRESGCGEGGAGSGGRPTPPASARGRVRARRRLGRDRSFRAPSRLAGRGGALPPGPRGLAGVSKVTLWCAAVAAAAGARLPPGLRLGSGSGSSRPGSAPARTTQHPDTHQGPPGRGRIPASLPQARRRANRCSRRLSPGVGRDVRAPGLPSLPPRLASPGPGGRETEL